MKTTSNAEFIIPADLLDRLRALPPERQALIVGALGEMVRAAELKASRPRPRRVKPAPRATWLSVPWEPKGAPS